MIDLLIGEWNLFVGAIHVYLKRRDTINLIMREWNMSRPRAQRMFDDTLAELRRLGRDEFERRQRVLIEKHTNVRFMKDRVN